MSWTIGILAPAYKMTLPIGAGSAGCALARRLWEKTGKSILVIETGSTAPWISLVPLMAPALQGYTADWGYKTVPQKYSQYGMNDRRFCDE
ncbi:UNVERIFIED_CONTAM: pno [Trichonephila clavipes]